MKDYQAYLLMSQILLAPHMTPWVAVMFGVIFMVLAFVLSMKDRSK